MLLLGDSGKISPDQSTYSGFINRLSEAITQSQHSSSNTGNVIWVLPRLEQVQLTADAQSQRWSPRVFFHPDIFKPFLYLPHTASLEVINNSGSWGNHDPTDHPSTTGMQQPLKPSLNLKPDKPMNRISSKSTSIVPKGDATHCLRSC